MTKFTDRLRMQASEEDNYAPYDNSNMADELRACADMIDELECILRFLACVDFNRFTEHDELLLESVLNDAKRAVESLDND